MMNETRSPTASSAFSFLSKSWKEVRVSADADLQLMKNRANSFKNLASSFDRELENLEIDFVKKLRPKITEFRKAYSWGQTKGGSLRLDLSGFRNAISEEVGNGETAAWVWEDEKEGADDWEVIRVVKSRLKEFERRKGFSVRTVRGGDSLDVWNWRSNDLVEKVKSSLKSICKEPEDSKEVPPLNVPELLACLVRQSEPFLDQLGVRRDVCDKIIESLCSRRKNQLLMPSFLGGESSLIGSDNIIEELDLRIASVVQSTGHCYEGGLWTDHARSEITDKKRHVAIVTTASLPWMTGTAVNPLFRAAYLAKSAKQKVTLLVPWLSKSDQELVYPNNITFTSPEEQESYIRNWLEERIGFKADFKISFYPGKFSKARRSIIPAGDTSQFIPSKDADIAVLEEPEHLNWYHHGKRWTDKFNHVVGIVHTNYLEYIKREKNGALQAFLVKHINNWVTRAYCNKVLRLSAATQDLPKSVVCNVHGVNPKFLMIGEKVAAERELGQQAFSKGAYFLGKMVWAKGYRELIDLLAKHKHELDGFKLDVFGNGEDALEVQSAAQRLNLNLNFLKGRDHADDSLHGYKVFINPSVSDVLCTATAEALAMGKFVVCANHPSNEFFRSFPNCLTYNTSEDFVEKVKEALASEPQPLTPDQMYKLSWEAATQRFLEHSDLEKVLHNDLGNGQMVKANGKAKASISKSVSLPNLRDLCDGSLAFAHFCLTGNEFLRLCTGAIPGTRDYNKQQCRDLNLLPPQVENPIYGW
ncbi:hypothetical protein MLD38_017610 [Melastoma candidum]|uniref:Uncharacterized protein n=1 Tax=Melastoma candidum TaxID=119954 RepID=A0ACB9QRQ0_9MYRT|nr:hypothetical protein MLD38_017610 [Melastoma candidum]